MPYRLVQRGTGDRRALIVVYLFANVPRGSSTSDAILADAAGPEPCIVAYDDADGEPLKGTISLAAKDAGVDGFAALALCGFSKGCSAVRKLLLDGAKPEAVICADGTHASKPPAGWQIDVWQDLAARARPGEALFVATHTYNTYVERLSPPDVPYLSTVSTLRLVTGWELPEGGPLDAPVHTSDGDFHVYSYASRSVDAEAHVEQGRTVLPQMVALHLSRWLQKLVAEGGLPIHLPEEPPPAPQPPPAPVEEKDPPPAPAPAKPAPSRVVLPGSVCVDPASVATGRVLRLGDTGIDVYLLQAALLDARYDTGTSDGIFGPVTDRAVKRLQRAAAIRVDGVVGAATRSALVARLEAIHATPDPDLGSTYTALGVGGLQRAQADLLAGVHEDLGHNDGRRIREYLDAAGSPRGSNYCAAAVRLWVSEAATELQLAIPVVLSVGAKATARALDVAGRWFTAAQLREDPSRVRPGMILVWDRSVPGDKRTHWWGHEGIAEGVGHGEMVVTIEANAGPKGDCVYRNRERSLNDARLLGAGWVD